MRVGRNHLNNAAKHLKPWIAKRTTIPVLECIQIQAAGEVLQLAATDLDTSARIDVPSMGDSGADPWAVCIKAQTLIATLAKLKGDVELAGADKELRLEAGSRTVKLKGHEAADFPNLPAVKGWETELEAGALTEALGRVGFAVSKEESRFALQAFYLETVAEGRSRVVATDGHRMAWADLACHGPDEPVLLPNDWIKVRGLGLAGAGELRLSKTHCAYRQGGVEVTGRLLEGTFPDYRRVTVKDHPFWAEAEAKAWVEALKWAGPMSAKGAVKMRANGDGVAIVARDPDKGECVERLEAEVTGEWAVGVNAPYLAEAIQALAPAERVRIRVTDETTQLGIEAETGQSVLMPVRI